MLDALSRPCLSRGEPCLFTKNKAGIVPEHPSCPYHPHYLYLQSLSSWGESGTCLVSLPKTLLTHHYNARDSLSLYHKGWTIRNPACSDQSSKGPGKWQMISWSTIEKWQTLSFFLCHIGKESVSLTTWETEFRQTKYPYHRDLLTTILFNREGIFASLQLTLYNVHWESVGIRWISYNLD